MANAYRKFDEGEYNADIEVPKAIDWSVDKCWYILQLKERELDIVTAEMLQSTTNFQNPPWGRADQLVSDIRWLHKRIVDEGLTEEQLAATKPQFTPMLQDPNWGGEDKKEDGERPKTTTQSR